MQSKKLWNVWLYQEMQRPYLITSNGFYCSKKAKQMISSIYCGFKLPKVIINLFIAINISNETEIMLWKIMELIENNELNIIDSVIKIKNFGNMVFKKNELHLAQLLYKMAYVYCCDNNVSNILKAQLCNNLSSIFCKNKNFNEATKWNELTLNYDPTYGRALQRKNWLLKK